MQQYFQGGGGAEEDASRLLPGAAEARVGPRERLDRLRRHLPPDDAGATPGARPAAAPGAQAEGQESEGVARRRRRERHRLPLQLPHSTAARETRLPRQSRRFRSTPTGFLVSRRLLH